MNNCRLCVDPIPHAKFATNVDAELPDGGTVAEKLDELFGILVGDYCDADVLTTICHQCAAKVVRCASGELSVAEMDQIKDFFNEGDKKARLFVRSGGKLNLGVDNPTLKALTNSPFGLTTPKAVTKRPIAAVAATTSKKSKLQAEDATLDWLRSQPGAAGLGGSVAEKTYSTPKAGGKNVVVREIHLDQDEDDDGRETVVKTKCPFCPKVYVLNSALINHVSQKHPDKPVKFKTCDRCSKKFLNAAELKLHKCAKAYSPGRRSWGWYRRGWW